MAKSPSQTQTTLEQLKIAFSERLMVALSKQNMSQADLAKMLGLSRATISRWLTDYPNLSSKKLSEVAALLNVSINWLLLGVTHPDKPAEVDLNCEERQLLLVLGELDPELREHLIEMAKILERTRVSTLNRSILRADEIIKGQKLPIAIIDMNGIFIYSNEHHDEFFGARACGKTMVGLSVYDVIPSFLHGNFNFDKQKTFLEGAANRLKYTGKRIDNGVERNFITYARYIETADTPAIFAIIFPLD